MFTKDVFLLNWLQRKQQKWKHDTFILLDTAHSATCLKTTRSDRRLQTTIHTITNQHCKPIHIIYNHSFIKNIQINYSTNHATVPNITLIYSMFSYKYYCTLHSVEDFMITAMRLNVIQVFYQTHKTSNKQISAHSSSPLDLLNR